MTDKPRPHDSAEKKAHERIKKNPVTKREVRNFIEGPPHIHAPPSKPKERD